MKILLFFLFIGLSLTYSPTKAIGYAKQYCRSYNPKYLNYRNLGGDSANFVSQCLIAGGEKLTDCKGKDSKGSIPVVKDLEECLQQKKWGVTQTVDRMFIAGYPFFIPSRRAFIATDISGNNIKYCSHTNDRCDATVAASKKFEYYVRID